jgi:hypothetical protein
MAPIKDQLKQLPLLLTQLTTSGTGSAGQSPAFEEWLKRTVRTARENMFLRADAIHAFVEKATVEGVPEHVRESSASNARLEGRTCISLLQIIAALDDAPENTVITLPTIPNDLTSLGGLKDDEEKTLEDMKLRMERFNQSLEALSVGDRDEEVWSFGFDRLQSCLDLEQLKTEIAALSVPKADDESEDADMPDLESPREVILERATTASTDFLAKLAEKTEKDWEAFTDDQLKWQRLLDKSNTGADVWSELE